MDAEFSWVTLATNALSVVELDLALRTARFSGPELGCQSGSHALFLASAGAGLADSRRTIDIGLRPPIVIAQWAKIGATLFGVRNGNYRLR